MLNNAVMKQPIHTLSILAICILAIAYTSSCYSQHSQWPEIKETMQTYCFVADEKEKFSITILDMNGSPLYSLEARFNAWKYGDSDYDYSGAFDCRLFPVDSKSMTYPTLFQNVKNATRDWQTDARFLGDELIGLGVSGGRSSRSLIQRCKVRGMYIEMEINNVIVDSNHNIKSLNFKITFMNDPTATSEISDTEVVSAPDRLIPQKKQK